MRVCACVCVCVCVCMCVCVEVRFIVYEICKSVGADYIRFVSVNSVVQLNSITSGLNEEKVQ